MTWMRSARAGEKFEIPVVPVTSPGFVGSKNLGNRIGGEALLEYVIGTANPNTPPPTTST
jgi:nitrogenase molybdenum-cofactor synthesis protein NifE